MLGKQKADPWNAVFAIVCCLLIALLLLDFVFVRDFFGVEISGVSMENTLDSGDWLYADKTAEPKRGDIVIIDVSAYREEFRFSGDNIIKRLIGMEGDAIRITGGKVYRRLAGTEEFVLLKEDYALDATFSERTEIEVGEGEIFFLGDNRRNSTDSRAVGCLKKTDIKGVVPEWAVKYKSLISAWENFRAGLLPSDGKKS